MFRKNWRKCLRLIKRNSLILFCLLLVIHTSSLLRSASMALKKPSSIPTCCEDAACGLITFTIPFLSYVNGIPNANMTAIMWAHLWLIEHEHDSRGKSWTPWRLPVYIYIYIYIEEEKKNVYVKDRSNMINAPVLSTPWTLNCKRRVNSSWKFDLFMLLDAEEGTYEHCDPCVTLYPLINHSKTV